MQGTLSSASVHLVRQGNKINKTKGASSLGTLATECFFVTIWFGFSFVVFFFNFYFLICSYKWGIINLVRKKWTTPEWMHCCKTSCHATTISFQNPEWKHNIKSPLGGKGSISYKKQCITSRTWGLHQMCYDNPHSKDHSSPVTPNYVLNWDSAFDTKCISIVRCLL